MSGEPAPTIHEAECAGGPSGVVFYGPEITFNEAVLRRAVELDVVVRGGDTDANRRLAGTIEAAVGPCYRSVPHKKAGPAALPHWQQSFPPPIGHTFYETDHLKARKKR